MRIRTLAFLVIAATLGCNEGTKVGGSHELASCARDGALTGAKYDVSKSRFAFGSDPVMTSKNGVVRWEGREGAVSIMPNGWAVGLVVPDAEELVFSDWSADPAMLEDHVVSYFAEMGVDPCQVTASIDGGSTGKSVQLFRFVDGIRVVDSSGSARLDSEDRSTSESLYWPEISANVVSAALEFKARLATADGLKAYLAKLPTSAQNAPNASVVIRHTSRSSSERFRSGVEYLVVGNGTFSGYDVDGTDTTLLW